MARNADDGPRAASSSERRASRNECRVEDQLRSRIRDLHLTPALNLALHWLEVPLDAVYLDREGIDQVEALRVFR